MNPNSLFQSKVKSWILVVILAGIPIFLQLGARGLNEPDEGRYAEMGREMLTSGDWLFPRLNGVPHYAKPPWIYWCIGASLKIFGINEWAARLPSALAGCITALTVFALGRRMAGSLGGLISMWVLTSSLLFFGASRLITPDMMLTACITLALYCFWRWYSESRSHRWLFGFYLVLSVAFLDKGPVGVAIPFLTILGAFLFGGKKGDVLKFHWGLGLLLIALIALPWFLVICSFNPDLYHFYLIGEIKDRLITGRGRVKDWYFFFWVLPIAFLPWTSLACSALRRHFQWSRNPNPQSFASCFLLSWLLFPFVLFTVSSSKLPTYILPLLVPLSLLIGTWTGRLVEEKGNFLPRWSPIMTWIILLCFVVGIGFILRHLSPELKIPWALFVIWGVIALGLGIGSAWVSKPNRVVSLFFTWWFISIGSAHIFLFYLSKLETELGHNSSFRELVLPIQQTDIVGVPIRLDLHPDGKKPTFARPGPRIAMYEVYFRSSSFYLMKQKNEVVPLYGGDSLWEIGCDRNLELKPTRDDLIELLKGPELVFVFTRPEHLKELRELTGMELPVIKTVGTKSKQVLLFSNH